MEHNLFLTEAASLKILSLLKDNGKKYLRIGVKGSGCQGYTYVLAFDNSMSDKDLLFKINNIDVLIDNKSIKYIDGMTLDWKESMMKKSFIFSNPNEDKKCGCGHSFSIKK